MQLFTFVYAHLCMPQMSGEFFFPKKTFTVLLKKKCQEFSFPSLVGLRRPQFFLVWSRKPMPLKWSGFWWLFLKVWYLCPSLIWWDFLCFCCNPAVFCIAFDVWLFVDLKLGISEKSIFDEFHPDAQDLFNVTCDLKFVCEKLNDRSQRHKRQVMVLNLFYWTFSFHYLILTQHANIITPEKCYFVKNFSHPLFCMCMFCWIWVSIWIYLYRHVPLIKKQWSYDFCCSAVLQL